MSFPGRVKVISLLRVVIFGTLVGLLLPPIIIFNFADRTVNVRITDIAIIVGCVLIFSVRCRRVSHGALNLMILAFPIWCMMTSLWSADGLRTLMYSAYLFEAYLTFIIASVYFRTTRDTRLQGPLRLFGLILAIQVVWMASIGYRSVGINPSVWKQYIVVPIGSSNFIAPFFEFIALYELVLKDTWWPILSGIMFSGIILTMSRGGIIIFLLVLALYLIIDVFDYKLVGGKRRVLSTVFAIFAISFVLWALREPLGDWFNTLSSSYNDRIFLAKTALNAFNQHPFIGVGLGAFGVWGSTDVRAPHNLWLQVLSETGIIGMSLLIILFLAVGYIIFTSFFKRYIIGETRELMAVSIGLVAILLHSTIEPFLLDGTSSIWFAFILAWVLTVPHGKACLTDKNQLMGKDDPYIMEPSSRPVNIY